MKSYVIALRGLVGFAAAGAVMISSLATAQDASKLAERVTAAMDECSVQVRAGTLKTHADLTICDNDAMTKEYQAVGFPYMDLLYQFEGSALDVSSKLDHQQISADDARTALAQAMLQMNTHIAQRAEQAHQAQINQDAAGQEMAEAARQAERERRRAIIMQMIQNNRPYQVAVPPITTQQGANCTTSYIGNQAYTHCQ